ncbi:hypothetical protein [Thermococcus henrietii]|uniref:hypothetical protein n=1 Tax=Thermococcus henrietii TaxID=2016361 RepID=UPI000C06A11B|nr:hypothetical protein [Thermococcus henrietii]
MRRNAKKRLIPLVFVLVLTLLGTALAVPRIGISVQKVGGGANSTVAVDTTKAAVNWEFSSNEPVITGATITLDKGPGVNGTWTFYVTLDNGNVISQTGSIKADQTTITVSNLNIDLENNYITKVSLVIAGKQVSVS